MMEMIVRAPLASVSVMLEEIWSGIGLVIARDARMIKPNSTAMNAPVRMRNMYRNSVGLDLRGTFFEIRVRTSGLGRGVSLNVDERKGRYSVSVEVEGGILSRKLRLVFFERRIYRREVNVKLAWVPFVSDIYVPSVVYHQSTAKPGVVQCCYHSLEAKT